MQQHFSLSNNSYNVYHTIAFNQNYFYIYDFLCIFLRIRIKYICLGFLHFLALWLSIKHFDVLKFQICQHFRKFNHNSCIWLLFNSKFVPSGNQLRQIWFNLLHKIRTCYLTCQRMLGKSWCFYILCTKGVYSVKRVVCSICHIRLAVLVILLFQADLGICQMERFECRG